MSGAYVKLFGSMLNSSIWCTDVVTRIVWLTLLLLADGDGVVWGAVPGIARQAGVEPEACRRSIDLLSAPDPDSRTPDEGGRRIVAVPGGWRIVNARKYREMQTNGQRLASERSKRYRDRKAGVTPRDDRDESRESRSEREEEPEGQVEGDVQAGAVATTMAARPPATTFYQRARCPDCHAQGSLRRSRKQDVWFCGTKLGGCDATFPLNHRAVMVQLDARARAAIETRVGKPPEANAGGTGKIRDLEFDEEAVGLAAELSCWLSTHLQPGELEGNARARWYVKRGIAVPSPAHMAIDRALDALPSSLRRASGGQA